MKKCVVHVELSEEYCLLVSIKTEDYEEEIHLNQYLQENQNNQQNENIEKNHKIHLIYSILNKTIEVNYMKELFGGISTNINMQFSNFNKT